jgi:dipeptidyl aminopeptidase/acylaminoacyl peptidase
VVVLTSALLGCSSTSSAPRVDVPNVSSSTASASPTVATTAPTPTPTGSGSASPPAPSTSPELPAVTDPVSLPALMRDTVSGTALRLGKVLSRTAAYTKYAVTYRSDALTITGIMNVPRGAGPFPVVVLLHGHIDEDIYVTGQGFRREQDSLARNGYVAFHIDYRNHAGSDDDPDNDVNLRLGYARDAIAAVEAVTASSLPFLDGSRIGIIGRSMGGGVAFNALVARPDLVDAVVTYASVSTNAVDNYDRWIRFADGRQRLVAAIDAAHGSPQQNPDFWKGISSRTYLDRITTPVLMHQGVVDDTCPVAWARATAAALRAGGADLTYYEYPGENHYMYSAWALSMQRTLTFLKAHLVA